MKVKTSELIGPALDWAVAQATGTKPVYTWRAFGVKHYGAWETAPAIGPAVMLRPYSTDRDQGWSIAEREIGNLWKHNKLDPNEPDVWTAAAYHKAPDGTMLYYEDGPTPLIAAMRCYVASKLGDTVDIPEELT